MNDLAARAVETSIQMEVKKDGLQQRQSGDWTLRLVVQQTDIDDRLTKAPMGTRFVAVLVEIGDNEEPVVSPSQSVPQATVNQPATSNGHQPDAANVAGKVKREWGDMSPAQQAGLLCNDPAFQKFLREDRGSTCQDAETAARAVRVICGVKSRSEINGLRPVAMDAWRDLVSDFRHWQRYPDAGEPW
jgi:hypothetical protein